MKDRMVAVLLAVQVLVVARIVSMAAYVDSFKIAVQIRVLAAAPKPDAMLAPVEDVDIVVKIAMVAVDRAMEVAVVFLLVAMEVAVAAPLMVGARLG